MPDGLRHAGDCGVENTVEGASRRWSMPAAGYNAISWGDRLRPRRYRHARPARRKSTRGIGGRADRLGTPCTLITSTLALQLDFQVLPGGRNSTAASLMLDQNDRRLRDLDGVRRYFSLDPRIAGV
jgi:hypothetical protein